MKKLFLLSLGLLMTTNISATSLEVDAAHSAIRFQITHLMISKVDGRFSDFSGTVEGAKDGSLKEAKINFIVQIASIDTANNDRDEHLRSDDFFNATEHPTAEFTSKSIKSRGGDRYELTGDLNLKGVTKEVIFNVTYLGKNQDPWGNLKHGYEATTEINREDFGLTWNQALETGGVLVGKNVDLTVVVQAAEKSE